MVGQQDRADARPLRLGQHLRSGSAGVRRVLGVGVEDRPVIVQFSKLRHLPARSLDLQHILVRRLEPERRHPLHGRELPARGMRLG